MTELRVERTVPATPERVWRALTEELAAWFWPPAWQSTATADVRAGGGWRIAAPAVAVGGEFVEVDEPRSLVRTWRWDGDDAQTLVTMTLEPADDGTVLTVVHEGFVTEEDRADHVQGWNDCLGRLEPHVLDS